MAAATDCIVLSSSPEHGTICPSLVAEKRPEEGSPCAVAELQPVIPTKSRPPTRSRFFATPDLKSTKTKATRKAKPTPAEPSGDISKEKPVRRKRNSNDEAQVESQDLDPETSENKENATTKPKRTRKKQGDAVGGGEKLKNKTITGKVTKSGTAKSGKASVKLVEGESPPKKTVCDESAEKDECGEDLQLEQAVKRRLDWTPTKATAKSGTELEDGSDTEGGRSGIGSILSRYGYVSSSTTANRSQTLLDEGPTKRRRIELVDPRVLPTKPKALSDESTEISEEDAQQPITSKVTKKPKPRAKRITTLTGRMTALYQKSTSPDSETQGTLPLFEDSAATKPKARKPKKKADENSGFKFPPTIVLPPDAAVKSLDQQDLVFGTCSQLEREDSPTLLRDMQTALRESEMSAASSFCSNQSSGFARSSTAISRLAPKKNLWSVAARDSEGAVVDVEVINLIDSPEAPKAIPPPVEAVKEMGDEQRDAGEARISGIAPSTGTLSLGSNPVNEDLSSTSQTVEPAAVEKPMALPKKPMPHYQGKTDLELAKEIKRYGLKAIKSRMAMIAVLERCWVAKHGPVDTPDTEVSQREQTTSTAPAASQTQQADKEPEKPKATSQRKPKVQSQAKPKPSKTTNEVIEATATITTTTTTIKENVDLDEQITSRPSSKEESQPTLQPVRAERSSQQLPKRSYIDVEEIQDSEDEDFLPSPTSILNQFLEISPQKKSPGKKQKPQQISTFTIPSSPSQSPLRKVPSPQPQSNKVKKPQPRSKSKPKTPRTTTSTTTKEPSDTNLPSLSTQITNAVRAQPRQGQSPSGKLNRPSWHEKILMYDPIYLEDFTAWLNSEGLGLVDEDREVGTGFVREWCEGKGICCCFRAKRNGGHH
ncbi:protein slx4 [Aspergillus stella-maris]|uniref:protein slx4 n=1 Tax=Aspergillus stella-maris TaxID=1810926 RepID=UPI003CCCB802